MGIAIIFLVIFLGIIALASYFIGAKLYKTLTAKTYKHAKSISIATGIVSFLLIGFILLLLLVANIPWGR